MTAGIYQIRNLVNDHRYIGSTTNLAERRRRHFLLLRNNKHHSQHLQSAYNKYDGSNFVFETLITCCPNLVVFYEQQFLDLLKPEYNVRLNAENNSGTKRENFRAHSISEETKQKMRAAHLGRKRPPHTEEWRQKLRQALTGRQFSDESKQKMSKSARRVWAERKRTYELGGVK